MLGFFAAQVETRRRTRRPSFCRLDQGYYEFNVDVAFYEIFDEMITDLLKPDNLASEQHFRCFIAPGGLFSIVHSYLWNTLVHKPRRVVHCFLPVMMSQTKTFVFRMAIPIEQEKLREPDVWE